MTSPATGPAHKALRGRQADSARRRARVTKAISAAATTGQEISASSIARAAAVDRTFLYRHRDLLEQIQAIQSRASGPATSPAPGNTSLQTDLLNAQQRAVRLAARIQQLERRLSELLGEQAWQASGLGAPPDINALRQQTVSLEQRITDLQLQLDERDQDLAAARTANRELMAQLNATGHRQ
jgi:chromosome segregation ATPase